MATYHRRLSTEGYKVCDDLGLFAYDAPRRWRRRMRQLQETCSGLEGAARRRQEGLPG